MPILEILLSSALQVLFDRLLSPDLLKFSKSQGIDEHVRRWKDITGDVREVLAHAEIEGSKNREVKRWLDDLRAFAYDAEDLLDEIVTDVSTSKHPKLKNQVLRVFDMSVNAINPISGRAKFSVESRMGELTRRLEGISKQKTNLGLGLCSRVSSSISISTATRESSFSFHKPSIHGRENDETVILKRVFSGSEEDTVIPIVGMGGLGKTTLAQMVFDSSEVKRHFHVRVWVCVALHFDIHILTKRILQSIIGSSCEHMDLPWLHEKLRSVLLEKKFLIVLDDVWDGFGDDWYNFYHPFRNGVKGCKFIVTTRSSDIASRMCIGPVSKLYHLKQMSDDDCFSLFAYHAVDSKNFDAHPHLQSIGNQIAKMCSGCPLVAMVLGRALRNKRSPTHWETIRDARVWDSLEENSNVTAGLMLSYQLLPLQLKPCFAYCSLFPKGHLFDKDELVRLWMAEGFLPVDKGKPIDVGSQCFSDLLSRSFFKRSSRGEKLFEMHDLISDLSRVAAADVFLHLDKKLESHTPYTFPQEVRHTSFVSDIIDVFDRMQLFKQMGCFRTLLALTSPDKKLHKVSLSDDVLKQLLNEVTRLRVLSLNHYQLKKIPDRVSYLKHLRYLNLSGTPLTCLPDSVTSLINLQALLLNNCHLLVKLPPDLENLAALRELDIADTPMLKEIPVGIGKLTSLRKLCKFIVVKDKGPGLGIGELENLSKLQGSLSISGLHKVVDKEEAKKANLKDKKGLDDLSMVWSPTFDGSGDSEVDLQVMKSLEPHTNLKRLKVEYYGGPEFAPWVGNHSFGNMLSMELYDCRKVRSLPSLGVLPLLTDLSIRGLHGVKSVGSEFYGYGNDHPFSRLQTLRFEDMPQWVEWCSPTGGGDGVRKGDVKRDFPRLSVLQMVQCPKLVGKLPEGMMNSTKNDFSPLESLELKDCPSLVHFPAGKSMSTPKLQKLIIRGASKLECIAKRMHELSISLTTIDFSGYTNLSRLPGSLHGLSNLKDLSIDNFGSLKCLPDHLHSLTSLQYLRIKNCQQLGSFPERGFPPHLTILSIHECTNIHQPMSEWGLDKLTSLKKLELHDVCRDIFEFPEDDLILPPSITHLSLSGFHNLVRLTEEIEELVSLESLSVINCHTFQCVECLPPMLNHFDIRGCPRMQRRCRRIDGDYWNHISHILSFQTD